MKITHLIPMTDFVLNSQTFHPYSDENLFELEKIQRYAEFLKQPLKLEMFVPCLGGEPFNKFQVDCLNSDDGVPELRLAYQKAKEKVLFAGFYQEYNATKTPNGGYLNTNIFNHKVEFLSGLETIQLTESALNQIYGTSETLST